MDSTDLGFSCGSSLCTLLTCLGVKTTILISVYESSSYSESEDEFRGYASPVSLRLIGVDRYSLVSVSSLTCLRGLVGIGIDCVSCRSVIPYVSFTYVVGTS